MLATPAKLRNGSWGARVKGEPETGEVVTITTKAGKSWRARVTRVLWSSDGVAICATESLDGGPPRRRSGYETSRGYNSGYETSCGYPCPVSGRICTPNDPCHDCQ